MKVALKNILNLYGYVWFIYGIMCSILAIILSIISDLETVYNTNIFINEIFNIFIVLSLFLFPLKLILNPFNILGETKD